MQRVFARGVLLLLAGLSGLPGCILIRTTEHRISIKADGSGEAVLRLIDLRSDEQTDSLVQRDFRIMMSSYDKEGVEDFARRGRTIERRNMYARDDTLIAEISYSFESLDAVEGLRVTETELYVVVAGARDVVRTNGRVEEWQDGSRRIVWKRDARRLLFQIRERSLPPSTSLAGLYRALE